MKVVLLRDAHAEGAAEQPRGALPKNPSLLFDCDLEEKSLEAAHSEASLESDTVRRVKVYSEPWSQAECKLAELVAEAVGPGSRGAAAVAGGRSPEAAVAEAVCRRGYAVTLRTALGGRSSTECLKNLRHTFLTCMQHSWPGAVQHFVIDLSFRAQFEISRPTARYTEALAAVPETFVGAEERLLALVEVLCRELTAAFEELGTPLPPWRQTTAMLTKWRPRRSQDVSLPPRSPAPSGGAAAAPPSSPPPAAPAPPKAPAATSGGGWATPSPFARHAAATFATLSSVALSAFKPTPLGPLGAPSEDAFRPRPKSSLLAASLHGSSGPLPANISLPAKPATPGGGAAGLEAGPGAGPGAATSTSPRAQPTRHPTRHPTNPNTAQLLAAALPPPPPAAASPSLCSSRACSAALSWADAPPLGGPLGGSGASAASRRSSNGSRGGRGAADNWAAELLGWGEGGGHGKHASCLLAGV